MTFLPRSLFGAFALLVLFLMHFYVWRRLIQAPRLKPAPTLASHGDAPTLTITLAPTVWPSQRVDVLVGNDPYQAIVAAKTTTIVLPVPALTPSEGPVPVRVRIEGAENCIVRDRSIQPPQFDPQQSITVS